jgi:hypothetical protein
MFLSLAGNLRLPKAACGQVKARWRITAAHRQTSYR